MTDYSFNDYGKGIDDGVLSTGSRRSARNSKNTKRSSKSTTRKKSKPSSERSARGNNNSSMQKPANIKGQKKLEKRRKKKNSQGKFSKWSLKKKILMSILGVFLAAFVVFCGYGAYVIATAPDINPSNIYNYIAQQSTLYDKNGKQIDSVFVSEGNRENVKYNKLPEDLKNAVVAIEDKTFWNHHGFNFVRMAGAVVNSVTGGNRISGTSTITQQLARNVYLSEVKSERSLTRKLKEAFYTMIIEHNLNKEQIMEAYLNTIYLGYGSYGVEAASKAYFNKDISKLTLAESAAIAALPQKPDGYALVKTTDATAVDESDPNVLYVKGGVAYIYNGDASKDRRETCLREMLNQGYITEKQYKKALKVDLKKRIRLNVNKIEHHASYFTDYVIDELTQDIMDQKNYSYSDARNLIYTGGLKIYTTLDQKAQKIVEKEFKNEYNFPSVTNIITDGNNNVLDKEGRILLYDYDNFINSDGDFYLDSDDYTWQGDGALLLKKGHKLKFYDTEVNDGTDISVELKPIWLTVDGVFNTIETGVISIPAEYKTKDGNGNCIISAEFFKDFPEFFIEKGSSLLVKNSNYSLNQPVRQPQSAMVIIDNKTGGITAMVGGRDISGQMLYNRAVHPRQPGSSIKPLAVYSSALQLSADAAASGTPMTYVGTDTDYYGEYMTAVSAIKDEDFDGSGWPKNWYDGYRGWQTLRQSVEQSINVNAVRVFEEVGVGYAISQLEKFGITSVVEGGSVNDENAAALALGGMTNGISPLELASAYSTFPNKGIHKESTSYTRVLTQNDEDFLECEQEETKVLDESVAFVMSDILRTTVSNGLGINAALSSTTVCGKTGTTSDNYDMWFAGYTAQYSAALWWGTDVNLELTGTSDNSAALWGTIMGQVTDATGDGSTLPEQPDSVIHTTVSGMSDYFVEGTVPSYSYIGDAHQKEEEEQKLKEEEEKKKEEEEKQKEEEERQQQEEEQGEDDPGGGDDPGGDEPIEPEPI